MSFMTKHTCRLGTSAVSLT
uniref:Uncharacterized protein n=1 Tax=Anguilla anguilla TaxID=7936 RepID=A0A0E9W4G1_ANGAN